MRLSNKEVITTFLENAASEDEKTAISTYKTKLATELKAITQQRTKKSKKVRSDSATADARNKKVARRQQKSDEDLHLEGSDLQSQVFSHTSAQLEMSLL